ncbi:SphA family protein [Paraburkholderia fungorum]|uniref:SphA family protein n=1 Tax=Paraburkholderia fungorum TaxID=134537 RepID=UPI0038BCFB3F
MKQLVVPKLSRRAVHALLPPTSLKLALVATFAMVSIDGYATEGWGNSYPIGNDTANAGMMLPEGLHTFLFYQHYTAPQLKDNNGNDYSRASTFKIRADAVAVRLSFVWPGVKVFGANIETRLIQAYSMTDLTLDLARPAPLRPLDKGGHKSGFTDTLLVPIILGWHSQTYHQTVSVETQVPTGAYDVTSAVNIGRNYYQIAPTYALTWLPTDRIDISAKFRYAFNTNNRTTNYDSGDEATIEFSAGYRITPALAAGLNGYIYRQTTDDRQNGVVVNGNGNRGRVDALGPYIRYSLTAKIAMSVKLQQEFDARNRPQGTRVWAQVSLPF